MNSTPTFSILIVYPVGGERAALDLLPVLDHMGNITLRRYEKIESEFETTSDVALCIVTDDSSIEAAHRLQKALDGTPTLVVDQTHGRSIRVNGFAGLTPPGPEAIAQTVESFLQQSSASSEEESENPPRLPLAGRFDTTLSRLGGLQGSAPSMLAAAARQLAHELRAAKAEAWLIEQITPKCVFRLSSSRPCSVTPRLIVEIDACPYLTTFSELDRRSNRGLVEYLRNGQLNVVAPIRANDQLLGWISFRLRNGLLTDEFLDDLHIATHLLGMVLPTTFPAEIINTQPVSSLALSALNMGILIFDRDQKVKGIFGDLSPTGSGLQEGDSVLGVRNSRIREIIIEAFAGNHMSDTWDESGSTQGVSCSTVALGEGTVALHIHRKQGEDFSPGETVEIASLISSLPVPVMTESGTGTSSSLPSGRLNLADADAVRLCAVAALDRKAKSMRLRLASKGDPVRAVLFFETPVSDESHLVDDLTKAVAFTVHP